MKNTKTLGLLTLLFIILFYSCSSDSEGGSSSSQTSMSAKIDGQVWKSLPQGVQASIISIDDDNEMINVLQLMGASTQSTVSFQFPISSLTEGTHTFYANSPAVLSLSNFTNFEMFNSSEDGMFKVTITNVNTTQNTISGTFSGTIYDSMGSGQSKSITDGVFNNINVESLGFYSNGYMKLSKNNNAVFSMNDEESGNSKIMILENSLNNSITVNGSSLKTNADFGTYSITFPKDITPGTYQITASGDIQAQYSGNEYTEFSVSNGTFTVISHTGNTVKATFSYSAFSPITTINISQGELEITHLD